MLWQIAQGPQNVTNIFLLLLDIMICNVLMCFVARTWLGNNEEWNFYCDTSLLINVCESFSQVYIYISNPTQVCTLRASEIKWPKLQSGRALIYHPVTKGWQYQSFAPPTFSCSVNISQFQGTPALNSFPKGFKYFVCQVYVALSGVCWAHNL